MLTTVGYRVKGLPQWLSGVKRNENVFTFIGLWRRDASFQPRKELVACCQCACVITMPPSKAVRDVTVTVLDQL